MKWELIGTWDSAKGSHGGDAFKKAYYLLPTVDHLDPEGKDIRFEICFWQINSCKNDLSPDEFVALCKKIIEYRQGSTQAGGCVL